MSKENTSKESDKSALRKTNVRRSDFIIKSVFINNKEYKVENGFIIYNINDSAKNAHQY